MISTEEGRRKKNRPLDSLNLPHTLCPCHLIDRCTLSSFFRSLLLLTQLSIYGHFHYLEQNQDFLRSVPGIQCLINCAVRSDCGSICRRCLAVSDTLRVITETRGTKGDCCLTHYKERQILFFCLSSHIYSLFLHSLVNHVGADLIPFLHITAPETHVRVHVYSYH